MGSGGTWKAHLVFSAFSAVITSAVSSAKATEVPAAVAATRAAVPAVPLTKSLRAILLVLMTNPFHKAGRDARRKYQPIADDCVSFDGVICCLSA